MAKDSAPPYLQVVRGDATPEELAALVAVLTARARAASAGSAAPSRTTAWSARSRQVRQSLQHGPGAWRASAFPLR